MMKNNRLKKYFEIKQDPSLATLKMLEKTEEMASQMIEKAIKSSIQEAQNSFEKEISSFIKDVKSKLPSILDEVSEEIKEYVLSNPHVFKGEKGEDASLPSKEQLESIIKPLIPQPEKAKDGQDGKTPIAGLDYPSEEQIKTMISDMGKEVLEKHEKMMKKMPKIELPSFEEIARGIESLPEKQKLDYYRGLKNIPSQYSNENGIIKGGSGGGMGNWEHEEFNTSSATTTVTLSRNVAANSTAILVRYNGQLLAHGVQYTILGRIISFTFTLDDNSNVDVTYVRT